MFDDQDFWYQQQLEEQQQLEAKDGTKQSSY